MDEDEDDLVEIPSFRFRWIDGLTILADFVDNLAAALRGLTANVLHCASAHANYTLDQERSEQDTHSGVEII